MSTSPIPPSISTITSNPVPIGKQEDSLTQNTASIAKKHINNPEAGNAPPSKKLKFSERLEIETKDVGNSPGSQRVVEKLQDAFALINVRVPIGENTFKEYSLLQMFWAKIAPQSSSSDHTITLKGRTQGRSFFSPQAADALMLFPYYSHYALNPQDLLADLETSSPDAFQGIFTDIMAAGGCNRLQYVTDSGETYLVNQIKASPEKAETFLCSLNFPLWKIIFARFITEVSPFTACHSILSLATMDPSKMEGVDPKLLRIELMSRFAQKINIPHPSADWKQALKESLGCLKVLYPNYSFNPDLLSNLLSHMDWNPFTLVDATSSNENTSLSTEDLLLFALNKFYIAILRSDTLDQSSFLHIKNTIEAISKEEQAKHYALNELVSIACAFCNPAARQDRDDAIEINPVVIDQFLNNIDYFIERNADVTYAAFLLLKVAERVGSWESLEKACQNILSKYPNNTLAKGCLEKAQKNLSSVNGQNG